MNLVIDTSVVIAVIVNESHKEKLVDLTADTNLLAPASLHWEIGNAFSAMFKQKRITMRQALGALHAYQQIPIRFSDVSISKSLELAKSLGVYAYDAYVIQCALKHNCPIITLDSGLLSAAARAGATVLEVK